MKNSSLILLAAIGLVLSGCLTLEETITINADKSASVQYFFQYLEQNEPMVLASIDEAKRRTSEEDVWNFLDEKAVKKTFNDKERGIEVQRYRQAVDKDGVKTVQIVILVKKLEELNSGLFGPIVFNETEKTFTAILPEEMKQPISPKLQLLCPDLKGTLTFRVPEEITKSTGKYVEKKEGKKGEEKKVVDKKAVQWVFDMINPFPTEITAAW